MELLPADLNTAEQKIVTAFPMGTPVDISRLPDRRVRAEVIAAVLFGACDLPRGARPALRVIGARIAEELQLEAGTLTAPVAMTGCDFEAGVNLADSSAVTIRLADCRLSYLHGPNLQTQGDLELTDGTTVMGEVDLLGARIGGTMRLSGAHLHPAEGVAVTLSRARIEGGLFLRDASVCGQLCMISTYIGGLLTARGTTFRVTDMSAVNAVRAHIGETVFIDGSFRSTGRIYLLNSIVDGGIVAKNARISVADGQSINFDRAKIERGVNISGASLSGDVSGMGSRVGSNVDLDKTSFAEGASVDLSFAEASGVKTRFTLGPDVMNLEGAKFGVIEDDRDSWPPTLHLEGCTYGSLKDGGKTKVRDRLAWLARDPGGYSPQPYEQLATIYRARGDEAAARRVALERHRRRRRTLTAGGRAMSWFSEVTVGFGYRTWLAGIWLGALLATGATIFSVWPPAAVDPKTPRHFEPVVYTLDLLLPVADLKQEPYWQPVDGTRWFAWALILFGWGLGTAVIAGLMRLFNRN
ncbi:hypothetical protein GT755_15325 [Herbidospora sp. NEAU-GS84]|uniref:Oxidoreductase n=1 Tax=Herbidospora solisilvae TaxID=2696284 RepID=A0A7C9P0E3_9ACTN|nr:hypothetical protein [Herbidospora solisilvae]NAS23057.1 hypothetical protein [Herbidospora solisilvae]